MLCPRCKQPLQKVFEVRDVVVLVDPLTMVVAKPKQTKPKNPKAKPLDLPLAKPKPLKVRVVRLPRVGLCYCANCLTFYRDA